MAKVASFYSVNEALKPVQHRVHHNNNHCGPGNDIPQRDKRSGTGGYRLCKDCEKLT